MTLLFELGKQAAALEKQAVGANLRRVAQLLRVMASRPGVAQEASLPLGGGMGRLVQQLGFRAPLPGTTAPLNKFYGLAKGLTPQELKGVGGTTFARGSSSTWPLVSGRDALQSSIAPSLGTAQPFSAPLSKLNNPAIAQLYKARQLAAGQAADQLAMTGRHTPRTLSMASLSGPTLPGSPVKTDWGNLISTREGAQIGYTPPLLYKGMNGPTLSHQGPMGESTAQWFSGLPQVGAGYAQSHLWTMPTAKVPPSWNWNRTFTPHIGQDVSAMHPTQIGSQYAHTPQIGGNAEWGNHSLYETVAKVPDIKAPLQHGNLFKKLPSGTGFQQVSGSKPTGFL